MGTVGMCRNGKKSCSGSRKPRRDGKEVLVAKQLVFMVVFDRFNSLQYLIFPLQDEDSWSSLFGH